MERRQGQHRNLQRDTPANTYTAFTDYINNRTFNYDF